MNGKITGLGLWAWILERIAGGSVPEQVASAKALGARRVYIKVCDGISSQNGARAIHLADALAAEGIEPWAWGYIYDNLSGASKLVSRAREVGAKGIILNVEKQFADGETVSDGMLLGSMIRAAQDADLGPVAVSSYGRIDSFPSFPWHVLRQHAGLIGMPQVYGYKSPEHARQRARTAVMNYATIGLKAIIPTCGVWADETFDHAPLEVSAFAAETRLLHAEGRSLLALDAWSWQHIPKHRDAAGMTETVARINGALSTPERKSATAQELLPALVGDSKEWVKRAAFARLGRWDGPLFDSRDAPTWAAAVKSFQRDACLKDDGIWGGKTHAAVRAACAAAGVL